MTRLLAVTTLTLLLTACGGAEEATGASVVVEVTAACDVPLAGQCTSITTAEVTWNMQGGAAAWAQLCAAGAAGHPGTVVDVCPLASRVGRCVVTISSAAASAVAVYNFYATSYTATQAGQACAGLGGTFTAE